MLFLVLVICALCSKLCPRDKPGNHARAMLLSSVSAVNCDQKLCPRDKHENHARAGLLSSVSARTRVVGEGARSLAAVQDLCLPDLVWWELVPGAW